MTDQPVDELTAAKTTIARLQQLLADMQADQRASDNGAMMFIAAMVNRYGDKAEDGSRSLRLSEYDLLMGSEVTLHKANLDEGGVALATTIESNHERQLREAWNLASDKLPRPQPFAATLELPPDHIVTGEAATARGSKMVFNTGEKK